LKSKISNIAEFYTKTDKNFKNLIYAPFEEFNIVEGIKSICVGNQVKCHFEKANITVYAKKMPVMQALNDILTNSLQYSADKFCQLSVSTKSNHIEIEISNSIISSSFIKIGTYERLGLEWITKNGSVTGAGLYWAFQSVQDSKGEIELIPYNRYISERKFQLNIKLRKPLK
jgi:signal transduction histidine kinase